jgi:type III secretion protein I
MIEPVLAQTVAQTNTSVSAPLSLREQALGMDVARFATAMQSPTDAVARTAQAVLPASETAKNTLGDAILTGLKSASDDLGQRFSQAQSMLTGPDLSVADAMRLQLSIMQASMQYELINKGVSKMTQNIDQVLKTQ